MLKRRYVFGYGSLVNSRTHSYRSERFTRLANWRREWRLTHLRPVAFLSVRPEPGAATFGLMAEVPHRDWPALDIREGAYRRHDVAHALAPDAGRQSTVHVYSIDKSLANDDDTGSIYLSYIDVVAQGFMDHAGSAGVTHFFDTTDGWIHRIDDDRCAPRYGNAKPASDATRALVDSNLSALSVTVEKL